MNKYRVTGLILASFLTSAQSFCAENLELIEVKADKEAAPYYFGSSSTLNSEEMSFSPLPQLAETLGRVPSLVSAQAGGPGGQSSFFIRGTESQYVSFTLDNMKMNDPSSIGRQFDAAFFNATSLKEVRIHRGPQAVMYGSDALAGHIEMISNKGEDAPAGRVSLFGGSFGTAGGSIVKSWATGLHQGSLSFDELHTDGISRLNRKRFRANERDATDTIQFTSSSAHFWHEPKKIKTEVLLSYLNGKNELDGLSDNSSDKSANDQYLVQQKTSYQTSKAHLLSLRNGLNRHQRTIKSLTEGQTSYSGDLNQNEIISKLSWQKASLLNGVAHEKEQASFTNFRGSFELSSFFSQGLLSHKNWEWQGGVRAERHTRYGSFMTGATGIKKTFGIHNLSLQYGKGYKAPSLYNLYAPNFMGANVGNPDLVPESNHSLEMKYEFKQRAFDFSLAAFQNRLSNLITYTSTGYINQSRFEARGVELSSSYRFRNTLFALSGTHQGFRLQKTPVLRRPRNYAQASASFFPLDSLELFSKFRWFDSRLDRDFSGNTVKLSPFEVLDLGVRKTLGSHELTLQVLNLLDREYEEVYGFSVMPRSLFAGYGFKF